MTDSQEIYDHFQLQNLIESLQSPGLWIETNLVGYTEYLTFINQEFGCMILLSVDKNNNPEVDMRFYDLHKFPDVIRGEYARSIHTLIQELFSAYIFV